MRILKLYPHIDKPERFNYNINFGIWDAIQGDKVWLEEFKGNLDNYDIVLLPQCKRWANQKNLINKIKGHKIKAVLFDNDSCYYNFNDERYKGFDYIFYRDLDKNKKEPNIPSSYLKWSIDTDKYHPKYGGSGISFNCSVSSYYPLRMKVKTVVKNTFYKRKQYISHLQNSAAAIHTDSDIVPAVRGKILEFAACGTQIISNRTQRMELYFPDELIVYFNDIPHLKQIVNGFKPDIEIQKKLREITVEKHDDKVRAKEVLSILSNL